MTTIDSTATSVTTAVTANGGGGGSTDYGTPGAGGAATATVSTTSTSANSVTGAATANGGQAGQSSSTLAYGAGGNASASAAVSANNGYGQATASATGGYGSGSETANAVASVVNATSGYAQATSKSQGPDGSVTTSAYAPVGGPASATTEANINSALSAVPLFSGEAVSVAELTPGGTNFGLGGFGAESDGSNNLLTYTGSTDFTFLTSTTEDIFLNLTSGAGTLPAGDTFSLIFGYDINGSGWVYSPTFTTLAAADAYFNGMAIDLGTVGAGTQDLDLSYQLTAMGDPPSYAVTYDISGTGVTPTVPEPSTWAMMVIGFAGLGYVGWRRANRAKASAA
jgi:PEP-CTERM motif